MSLPSAAFIWFLPQRTQWKPNLNLSVINNSSTLVTTIGFPIDGTSIREGYNAIRQFQVKLIPFDMEKSLWRDISDPHEEIPLIFSASDFHVFFLFEKKLGLKHFDNYPISRNVYSILISYCVFSSIKGSEPSRSYHYSVGHGKVKKKNYYLQS